MIVSILQLMGFSKAEPVHSRAGEVTPKTPTKGAGAKAGPTDHAQMTSARRPDVKTSSGKDSKAATANRKAPAAAAAKSVAKTSVKPVHAAKLAAKPTAKASPKVAAKAAKPVAKPAAKVATKPAATAAKKVAASAKPASAKVVSKPSPTPRAPVSSDSKPVSKAPVKSMQTSVPSKSKSPVSSSLIVEKVTPAAAALATAATAAAAPAKAGRPSSRLAQLTVPSMAQTVASTAAKASYAQSTPEAIIVPALPSSIKKDPKLANNWKTTAPGDLTDAELMAMPDSEYMNAVHLAAFRLKLTKLKLDILNSAGETTEHLREDTSVVPDPADRATIEEEHALELRTRDRERKLLKKIEQSIGRIDAGDYGYCDETGEPIGVGRLLARPTATLSLEAQQRRELKQKMFGD